MCVSTLVFQLIGILRRSCMGKQKENRRNREVVNKIKEITNYLDKHYAENLTLTSVAEQFHYTPAYLSRLFKKHTSLQLYK